jgi:pimeloyl-ACP methyl ester carboxylesterase
LKSPTPSRHVGAPIPFLASLVLLTTACSNQSPCPDDLNDERCVDQRDIVTTPDSCVDGPSDFGLLGAVDVLRRYEVGNPLWERGPVSIYVPVAQAPEVGWPLVLFSHGYGASTVDRKGDLYRGLIELMVSQGMVVIYPPYPSSGQSVCERYDTLWRGFEEAVSAMGTIAALDLSRVAAVGHSFGGGASPWVAAQAQKEGWGENGLFVNSLAPWYRWRIDDEEVATMSADIRLAITVYEDDETNDHRIAIEEQWQLWSGPKTHRVLNTDAEGDCDAPADHAVPTTHGISRARLDVLDFWGTFRIFHALAACTFEDDQAACEIVDGTSPVATDMGVWPNGSPVKPATLMAQPESPREETAYRFSPSTRSEQDCDGQVIDWGD